MQIKSILIWLLLAALLLQPIAGFAVMAYALLGVGLLSLVVLIRTKPRLVSQKIDPRAPNLHQPTTHLDAYAQLIRACQDAGQAEALIQQEHLRTPGCTRAEAIVAARARLLPQPPI